MRINQYLARATGVSRRKADGIIASGTVMVNGKHATLGQSVTSSDTVIVNGTPLMLEQLQYLLFNKPAGYVASRRVQGNSPTIYELLPKEYHHLKPVGRLDKDSRGLLLLTNDGDLAQELTHPSRQKTKIYHVKLHTQLKKKDLSRVNKGIELKDGISRLQVSPLPDSTYHLLNTKYQVKMEEGRNRQIRRTFSALGYEVLDLLRVQFGNLKLEGLKEGMYREIPRP